MNMISERGFLFCFVWRKGFQKERMTASHAFFHLILTLIHPIFLPRPTSRTGPRVSTRELLQGLSSVGGREPDSKSRRDPKDLNATVLEVPGIRKSLDFEGEVDNHRARGARPSYLLNNWPEFSLGEGEESKTERTGFSGCVFQESGTATLEVPLF